MDELGKASEEDNVGGAGEERADTTATAKATATPIEARGTR